ncbi:hypothetical protein K8I28_15940 [bacterium]|nr:hypothetical protein [bacterium]
MQLVALRNYFGSEQNSWNDCIVVAKGSLIHPFRCTTDPGIPKHPNPKGIAWLSTGQVYRFQRGLHRGRPALIQAEPFIIDRYPPGVTPDSSTRKVRDGPGFFTINIHDAFPVIEDEVNGWSAGCIAIRRKDGWQEFLQLCHSGRVNHRPQHTFPLKLFDSTVHHSNPNRGKKHE